jgi:hypothetical protein
VSVSAVRARRCAQRDAKAVGVFEAPFGDITSSAGRRRGHRYLVPRKAVELKPHWASLLECRRWARHDAVHGPHEQRGTSASLWIGPVAPNPLLRSHTPPSRPRRPTDKSVRSTTPANRCRRCAKGYGRISQ